MRLFSCFRATGIFAASLSATVLLAACGGGGSGTQALPPAATGAPAGTGSTASTLPASGPETTAAVVVSQADAAAAKGTTNLKRHILRVPNASLKTAAAPTIQYPEDMTYAGGPLLTKLTEHNVYVSVTGSTPKSSTWGNPYQFLADLGKSNFIHVTDQYTKTSGTYTPGQSLTVSSSNLGFAPLYDNDILAIVHVAASHLKQHGETGYERIYNVYLPPGVDTCVTFTTQCYSPDNLATFAFCAYHSSVDFPDVGHVVYTLEPYQAALVLFNGSEVPGCSTQSASSPNFVAFATDSTVSHEMFESITDPDPSSGWSVAFSNGGVAGGYEIGDLCAYAPSEASTLNGTTYAIQPEYSNTLHGCVNDNITTTASTQFVQRN